MELPIDKLWSYVSGFIGVCLIGGVILLIRSLISNIAGKVVDNISKTVDEIKETVIHSKSNISDVIRKNNSVNIELQKILIASNAKRVSVFSFHNGNVFTTNNPVWKISQTHEACMDGVSSEISDYQEIKASLLTPFFFALFFGQIIDEGISLIISDKCRKKEMCKTKDQGIYKLITNKITQRYLYTMLSKRGGDYAYVRAITNLEDDVLGFVLLEYVNSQDTRGEEYVKSGELCDSVDRIYNLIR